MSSLGADGVSTIDSSNYSALVNVLDQVFNDSSSQQVSRAANLTICQRLKEEMDISLQEGKTKFTDEILVDIMTSILNRISNHTMRTSFDESDYMIRNCLFAYHVACGEYKIGASFLAEANMDSGAHVLSTGDKADLLVKCAEAFLKDEENDKAETMLQKVNVFMFDEQALDPILLLRYRVVRAEVYDR